MISEPYEINVIRRKDVFNYWRGNLVLRNGWSYNFYVRKRKKTHQIGTYLLVRDGSLSKISTGDFIKVNGTVFCEMEVPNFYA